MPFLQKRRISPAYGENKGLSGELIQTEYDQITGGSSRFYFTTDNTSHRDLANDTTKSSSTHDSAW